MSERERIVAISLLHSVLLAMAPSANAVEFVDVPNGTFRSSVRADDQGRPYRINDMAMMKHAVTIREFEAFVSANAQWRRDRIPALLADAAYLAHWQHADTAGPAHDPDAPATQVSWFAADAYCASIDARLPDWAEWEYVAASDDERRDARDDATRRARLLDDGTPRAVDAHADAPANVYGVYGMHGAAWEWVGDYASLFGNADKRGAQDGDRLRFCGASGLAFANPDDYAVLKRVALLSAMEPRSTLANLGFRCVRSSR